MAVYGPQAEVTKGTTVISTTTRVYERLTVKKTEMVFGLQYGWWPGVKVTNYYTNGTKGTHWNHGLILTTIVAVKAGVNYITGEVTNMFNKVKKFIEDFQKSYALIKKMVKEGPRNFQVFVLNWLRDEARKLNVPEDVIAIFYDYFDKMDSKVFLETMVNLISGAPQLYALYMMYKNEWTVKLNDIKNQISDLTTQLLSGEIRPESIAALINNVKPILENVLKATGVPATDATRIVNALSDTATMKNVVDFIEGKATQAAKEAVDKLTKDVLGPVIDGITTLDKTKIDGMLKKITVVSADTISTYADKVEKVLSENIKVENIDKTQIAKSLESFKKEIDKYSVPTSSSMSEASLLDFLNKWL